MLPRYPSWRVGDIQEGVFSCHAEFGRTVGYIFLGEGVQDATMAITRPRES